MSDRPRFQYSLGTLFVIMTVSAALLGLLKCFGMLSPTYIIASIFLIVMVCLASTVDPLAPQRLASFPSKLQAEALVKALASEEIRAVAAVGNAFGSRDEAVGEVQVVVASKDLLRAREILEQFEEGATRSQDGADARSE
jgi:hypothetical protein